MEYEKLAEVYRQLESTTKRLEKTYYLSKFLKGIKADDLEVVIPLLQGRVFPPYDERKMGVAAKMMLKAINAATGASVKDVENEWKKTGDLGDVCEKLFGRKKQATLLSRNLTVKNVFDNLRKLAEMEGAGMVDKKVKLIAELLTNASPVESRFIVRTVLEELRVGVAEGTLRDAIVWAYFDKELKITFDEEKKTVNLSDDERKDYNDHVDQIQEAFDIVNDYGKVARMIKEKGLSALKKLNLEVRKPVRVMLYQKAESIKDAFERVGKPCVFEYKYDGFRLQIHKQGNKITLYTRHLEDVTSQFPEAVEYASSYVDAREFILDAEAIGYNPKTRRYMPFQNVSQRIKRKYDIEEIAKKLPVEVNVFDIMLLDGKSLLKEPFSERRKVIERIVKDHELKIRKAKQIITADEKEAEKFYNEALKEGQEGVMAKNLEGIYKPGSRVGFGVKVKPTMETLDLVIVSAEWGSFVIACYDEDNGEFVELGKVGTGIKEIEGEGVTFEQLTQLLKPLIIEEKGREIKVNPAVVIEITYEEIQRSPTYSSGYALRFPRVVKIREDKPPEEVATLEMVEEYYDHQRHGSRR